MDSAADLTDSTRIARPDYLVASEVDGEMVVLNVENGYFFHLNGVGAQVWDALQQPMTFGDLCRAMEVRFEVDPATCRADIAGFVAQMARSGLVDLSAGG